MSGPRCSVCGIPLWHIDAACPRCLPNFYGQQKKQPEYPEPCRGCDDKDATLAALREEVERLKEHISEISAIWQKQFKLDAARVEELEGLVANARIFLKGCGAVKLTDKQIDELFEGEEYR